MKGEKSGPKLRLRGLKSDLASLQKIVGKNGSGYLIRCVFHGLPLEKRVELMC